MTQADADIRWSGTSEAGKALADNRWYMAQATMYSEAAAAHYTRALHLSRIDAARPAQREGVKVAATVIP